MSDIPKRLIPVPGVWWNMAFGKSYCIGYKKTLNIARDTKDLKPRAGRLTVASDWLILAPECRLDQCYRYSRWL